MGSGPTTKQLRSLGGVLYASFLPSLRTFRLADDLSRFQSFAALTFAFQYGICYTAAITFAAAPYNYGPILIGVILLAFGVGCVGGSVLGGRWSDKILKEQQLKMSMHREDEEGNLTTTPSSPEVSPFAESARRPLRLITSLP